MEKEPHYCLSLPAFDRELSFQELMGGIDRNKLMQCLSELLHTDILISARDGQYVIGTQPAAPLVKYPIRGEMEPVAYLEVNESVDVADVNAAVVMMELLLRSSARYLMASDLHLSTVQDDFNALSEKHQALLESETKYRELSAHLEERVAEQVKTIESAQRQLYQSEKMASVGHLAAGVAHEINNPIGFIRSNLSTAKNYIDDLKKVAELVRNSASIQDIRQVWEAGELDYILSDFVQMMNESIEGADRVTKIVKDLKDFSNIDHNEINQIDINDVIKSVCDVADSQIREKAKLVIKTGDIPQTLCRPGFLAQAFINILLNAVSAIDREGLIEVSSNYENGSICIRIRDNGRGIPQEIINNIFDPFFTTSKVGSGTGLGLTVSRDIVAAHKGRIDVVSEPGKGSTFIIQLPVISSESALLSNSQAE